MADSEKPRRRRGGSEPAPGAGQPVRMREVAEAAGVSVSTVSLVINDKKNARIGADARQRVHDAIDRLGYRPNALAKNLVSGQSRFIGLVADAIATTPFAGQIIHGAQDEAWKQGYVLLVANTEEDASAEHEAIAMMLEHKVRGILYSTWYHRAVVTPPSLYETELVLVDCFDPAADGPAVVPDEVQGGRTATQMLLADGHRRIAFINTLTPSPARTGRLSGYQEALAEAGIPYDPGLVFNAEPDQEGGFAIADGLLATEATAVFCHNDRVAMGLYDALGQRGLRVPADLSVVGFDNQEVIAAHLHPPLSTVALPHYELGALGVRVLLGLTEPGETGKNGVYQVKCPPVERASSRPAQAERALTALGHQKHTGVNHRPARVPLRPAAELDERSQRTGLLPGPLPPVLPAQPARKRLGEHELGSRVKP